MNIDEMQAGRELDALIAEKVMGLPGAQPGNQNQFCEHAYFFKAQNPNEYYWNYKEDGDSFVLIPHYSTDIAAAWQVVEKIKQNHQMCLALEDFQFDGKYWQALFKSEFDRDNWKWRRLDYAFADTPELAICKAALRMILIDTGAVSREESYAEYNTRTQS